MRYLFVDLPPRMPHVLFVNRVYPPAGGATGELLSELAPDLANRGWDVTVLTGPAETDGGQPAPSSEVTATGVRVERVGAARFTRASTWKRALAYLSLYPAFVWRALRLPAPDVIVTKTDPPMLKVLGPLLARLTGAAAVHWAQDLYPEVAEELGVVPKGGTLAAVMRRLSTAALRGHDHVVAVGRCMHDRIVGRGVDRDAVSVIPNWPPQSIEPVPHAHNPFRREHDLNGRFVVMYSGNMGLAHPFGPVLDAADELDDAPPDTDAADVEFVFVGDGPRKPELQAAVRDRSIGNVRFLPFQPRERLDESLSAADLHLVTMEPELSGLVVPSKTYGVLAAGRPALFLGPQTSEAAQILLDHDCGSVVPDPMPSRARIASLIRTWSANDARRRAAGQRARQAVATARVDAFDAFDTLLQRLATGS